MIKTQICALIVETSPALKNSLLRAWPLEIRGKLQPIYHRDLSILDPLLLSIFLSDVFFFLKDANLGKYTDDSTLYAYNENLENCYL